MTVKSHVTLSMIPVFFAIKYGFIPSQSDIQTIALLGTFVGSILPDIDEPNSYIGHKLIFFSEFFKLIGIKHRTVTHSIFFPLFISILGVIHPIFYFIAFGVLMHILEDAITNSGVPLLYPISDKRIGIRLFNTGSIFEFLFTGVVLLISVIVFIKFNILPTHKCGGFWL